MGAEWAELAAAGAAAFVTTSAGAMAGDAWEQAKGRMARLLGRGRDERLAAAEIEVARVQLQIAAEESGDPRVRSVVEGEWAQRLNELLAREPSAAGELVTLTEELRRVDAAAGTVVHFTVSGGRQENLTQVGTVMGDIHVGGAAGAPRSRRSAAGSQ